MQLSRTDNQLSGARNLGTFPGTYTKRDFVGRKDKLDYYKVVLSERSSLSLSLRGLKTNADLSLLRSNGTVLAKSNKSGRKPESLQETLEPGIYYIKVNNRSGDTRYTLKASATSIATDDTSATARNLGTLSGSSTFNDSVEAGIGAKDPVDWYRFSLNQTSALTINPNPLGSLTVRIYRDLNNNGLLDETSFGSFGQFINDSIVANTSLSNPTLAPTLAAGNYFISVQTAPGKASTQYSLALTATPITTPGNADNTSGTARNLGTLSGSSTFNDFVDAGTFPTDSIDWYRFNLSQTTSLTVNSTPLGSQVPVGASLYRDSNNNGSLDGDENDSVATTVGVGINKSFSLKNTPSGTYFIAVSTGVVSNVPSLLRYNSTQYSLTLTEGPASIPGNIFPDPGSTEATAYNLGTLSSSLTIKDYLSNASNGVKDEFDYYKFTLTQSITLNASFKLDGAEGEFSMALVKDINGNGVIETGEGQGFAVDGVGSNSISTTLSSGVYFLVVTPSGGVNSLYEITLGIG